MTNNTRRINVRINVDEKVFDSATGLPLLPEGWAWKVERFDTSNHTVYNYQVIAVWRKVTPRRPLFGIKRSDQVEEHRSQGYWDLFKNPEELVQAAQNAARYGHTRTPNEPKPGDDDILGYYPPKTAAAETGAGGTA